MTVPVRYMVVGVPVYGSFGEYEGDVYQVRDTSFEGDGTILCVSHELAFAHRIAKLLNREEGYEYPDS